MWWDERRSGGRLKALLFLLHPGPSLLVTATFLAIGCLAAGGWPGGARAGQLTGIMLPIQFSIGISNDASDVRADATAKPYKPLVRGAIGPGAAIVVAVALAALCERVAGHLGRPVGRAA